MFRTIFNTSFVKFSSKVVRVVILLVLLLSLLPIQSKATAATTKWCWCTDYVARAYWLEGKYGNAGTWDDVGGYLQRNGYKKLSAPEAGAVVVMNSGYPGASSVGHVGIIKSLTVVSKGVSWKFTLAQGGNTISGIPTRTLSGCNNIQYVSWATYSIKDKSRAPYITFWRRPPGVRV